MTQEQKRVYNKRIWLNMTMEKRNEYLSQLPPDQQELHLQRMNDDTPEPVQAVRATRIYIFTRTGAYRKHTGISCKRSDVCDIHPQPIRSSLFEKVPCMHNGLRMSSNLPLQNDTLKVHSLAPARENYRCQSRQVSTCSSRCSIIL